MLAGLLAIAGCGLSQDVSGSGASGGPPPGSVAPPLTGSLVDGTRFDLAGQRGKPVVIDFFASWCGPCVAQQKDINAVATRYAGRVTFVGVDDREGEAAARGFLTSYGVPYSAIIDADGHIFGDYDIVAPPTTVVLDAQGKVVAGFLGGVTQARLSGVLDRLAGPGAPTNSSG